MNSRLINDTKSDKEVKELFHLGFVAITNSENN